MKKRKLRLTPYGKKVLKKIKIAGIIILLILTGIGFINLAKESNSRWDHWANKCDTENGYTCSYYQIRQMMIRGEK